MPKIFISYRRADSQTFTERIHDRLAAAFGESSVFQDVDSIRMGADFRMALRQAVESCDIVLVMIGSQWATVTDEQGRKRLFNAADFVRIEVESALNSQKIVIPVVIEGTALPTSDDLPPSLHELLFRNAAKIRHNPDFNRDMQRLIEQIQIHDADITQQRAEAEEAERKHQAEIEAQAKAEADEKERQRQTAEEAERQRQAEIETQIKAQAAEAERKRLAEEQIRYEEKARLRRSELAEAERERQSALPTAAKPRKSPEAEIKNLKAEPIAAIPLARQHLFTVRHILIAAGIAVLVIALAIGLNSIQKSAAIAAQRTQNAVLATRAQATQVVIQITQTVVQMTQDATIIGDPRAIGITHNADWAPVTQNFNGVPMVKVPSGCTVMGSTKGARDELPLTRVCIEQPFWLDKTEVSNAQFAKFGGKAAKPSNSIDDNLPRENITWFEARDFCAVRGARLPTEAEWEYAARGPDSLDYPWGNEDSGDKVVVVNNSNKRPAPVGSKPAGASWVGALDLSGNVWEWMSTLYLPFPYPTPGSNNELQVWMNTSNVTDSRTLRGGSWCYSITSDQAATRCWYPPVNMSFDVGLRCAISAPS